jgi:hypothetical protein
MGDEPLHPAELNLEAIASNQATDAFLQQLAADGMRGIGATIGMVANGMFIYGTLSPSREMGVEVDAFYEWAFDLAERNDDADDEDDTIAKARERVVGRATQAAEEAAKTSNDLVDKLNALEDDFDPATAPAELTREWVTDRARPVLTLQNALIVPPWGRAVRLPVMRLFTPHITGWWLVHERGEDGMIKVQHPPPGSEDIQRGE